MNKIKTKQIVLNMASVYKLIDLMDSEGLDAEIQDTLLDVSVAISLVLVESKMTSDEMVQDEQLLDILDRARQEIEQQGLSYADVIAHKPIYVGVKCGV